MITLGEIWKARFPDARVGILAVTDTPNQPDHPALASARQDLELELRQKHGSLDRKSLRELPALAAYVAFYRPFRKTYHLQLQLESVLFGSKPIFSPSALVSCMFMAELKSGLLTAGHDLRAVKLPLCGEVARGEETYQRLDGTLQQLKEGDLYIKDQQGVISSMIYGPDLRTQIKPNTDQAVFTTYGPPGICPELIRDQLILLERYLMLFAPGAVREVLEVV